jgi:hypothetical protein
VQERWLDRRDELDEEERKAWEDETKDMRDPPPQNAPQVIPTSKPPAEPPTKPKSQNSDDDMDDLEEMRQFMEKKNDTGINVVRK